MRTMLMCIVILTAVLAVGLVAQENQNPLASPSTVQVSFVTNGQQLNRLAGRGVALADLDGDEFLDAFIVNSRLVDGSKNPPVFGGSPAEVWLDTTHRSSTSPQTEESYVFHFTFSDHRGDYLGLPRPGTTPERFAPGFISLDGRHDHGLVFSPSGKQAAFMTASLDWKENRLHFLRQIEGRWTHPVEIEFTRKNWCLNPIFAADESRLIFSMVIGKDQIKYYSCDLTGEGYSSPHLLDTPLNDSTSNFSYYSDRAGAVYFCGVRPGGCGGTDLYVLTGGSGAASITPITELNSPLDDDSPFLSPDERYLVFNHQTKDPQGKIHMDVMFSYRTPSGQWSQPVNYGRHIGATRRNWRPVITADGQYLFFSLEGEKGFDVYWVSASVLEQLKPKAELPGSGSPDSRSAGLQTQTQEGDKE